MKRANLLACGGMLLALASSGAVWADGPAATVSVFDGGSQLTPATWECTAGHQIEKHSISLDSGKRRYTFLYEGCIDPSHGEQRPAAEGNFGMPDPTPANWYWGGFLRVLVNGTDAVAYRVGDMRVTERGARGAFQIVWAHPDAEVGLRLLMLPGANHVLALLNWKPKAGATLKTVVAELRCYPSFFTAARHRRGERHCQTPRIDMQEPKVLSLVPGQDTHLYYYDAVFDVARGEGDGPCAALLAPAGLTGGNVSIGDYAVITSLQLDPVAGQARLGLYDFTGQTNAEAGAYLKAHAADDLAQLVATDFHPEAVRQTDPERLKREAQQLLADAGDDGQALRPKVEELLARVTALKAQGDSGDWKAEADLADALEGSSDLFWKLRIFAVLNRQ